MDHCHDHGAHWYGIVTVSQRHDRSREHGVIFADMRACAHLAVVVICFYIESWADAHASMLPSNVDRESGCGLKQEATKRESRQPSVLEGVS